MGKHGPNNLRNYIEVHSSCMASLVNQGFVLQDDCSFEFFQGLIVLEGRIHCLGQIEVTVKKLIDVLSGSGHARIVQTRQFSYHANFANGPNILRYDSPVPHRNYFHKHRFDTFGTRREIEVVQIDSEEDVPTLGEVLTELQEWYWGNEDRIATL